MTSFVVFSALPFVASSLSSFQPTTGLAANELRTSASTGFPPPSYLKGVFPLRQKYTKVASVLLKHVCLFTDEINITASIVHPW